MWERALRESPKTSLPTKQKGETGRPEARSFGSGFVGRESTHTLDMAVDRAKTGVGFSVFLLPLVQLGVWPSNLG